VEYEVRFVLAGRESLLFTVDDERATVWVIALRGQGPLPKPENLPRSTGALPCSRLSKAATLAYWTSTSSSAKPAEWLGYRPFSRTRRVNPVLWKSCCVSLTTRSTSALRCRAT
jgi:hypothetical protein